MNLPRQRIRIAYDMSAPDGALDVETGQAPRIYRGYDAQLELLFKYQGKILDIGNINTFTMAIKTSARTGDPYVCKTASATDITITETVPTKWDDGSSQHALFYLNSASSETSMAVTGTETEYWLVVWGTIGDGLLVPLGSGPVIVEETGMANLTAPTPAPPVAYTKAEADARFLGGFIQPVNAAGITITLTHPTNGKQITLGVADDGELSINTISP